jgi:hypothetical protein
VKEFLGVVKKFQEFIDTDGSMHREFVRATFAKEAARQMAGEQGQ